MSHKAAWWAIRLVLAIAVSGALVFFIADRREDSTGDYIDCVGSGQTDC
jgi:hypothetical protein